MKMDKYINSLFHCGKWMMHISGIINAKMTMTMLTKRSQLETHSIWFWSNRKKKNDSWANEEWKKIIWNAVNCLIGIELARQSHGRAVRANEWMYSRISWDKKITAQKKDINEWAKRERDRDHCENHKLNRVQNSSRRFPLMECVHWMFESE